MDRKSAAVLTVEPLTAASFWDATRRDMEKLVDVKWYTGHENMDSAETARFIGDAEIVVTGWGTARMDDAVLAHTPNVTLVCHAAGSVHGVVSDALWDRGVTVTSAAGALAVGVAETTLALMILSAKQIWQAARITRSGKWRDDMDPPAADFTGTTIGVMAASHVGRAVIKLLKPFDVEILLYDPFVDEAKASTMGVKKVELSELLSRSDIVSSHMPSTDDTHHILNAETLALMKDGSTFINTSRGWVVDEKALIAELETGRITAVLDVTDPEPPALDSPLRKLENVILMPHMSGAVGVGRRRLGDYVTEEIMRFVTGKEQRFPVTRKMMDRIA